MDTNFILGLVLGFAVISVVIGLLSVFKVEEGHLAVLSEFGKVLSRSKDNPRDVITYSAGIHFKKPWQKLHEISTMERILDLSGKEGGTIALAADGTQLRLDSKLRYQIHVENIYAYLFSLRQPLDHIKGLFSCLLRNEIANFSGETTEAKPVIVKGATLGSLPSPIKDMVTSQDDLRPTSYGVIRSERRLLNQRIKTFCESQLDGKYGVQFNSVDLTDICPPDELAEALNAVFNAQLEAEAQFSRAEGECRQRIVSAEKGVEIAKSTAEATLIDITESGRHLEQLFQQGTLHDYVERRKNEVVCESRTIFMRS